MRPPRGSTSFLVTDGTNPDSRQAFFYFHHPLTLTTTTPKILMSKLWRALLISAVATGAAAVALKLIEPQPEPPAPASNADDPSADPDALTQEQQDLLMQELGAYSL